VSYRLLVDLEVVEVLNGLPRKVRDRLMEHFGKLRRFPDTHSDFQEKDRSGRQIEISIFAGFAVHYWIDFADRHVKILLLKPAWG
jgi:hypothetical protein